MNVLAATVAIMACVITLLPFGSVNGDGIKILSAGGSYVPGNIKFSIILWEINMFRSCEK